MARPRLSDPGVAIRIRVRESDLAILKQAAEKGGENFSEFCRSLLQEFIKDYRDKHNIPKPEIQ